MLRRVVGLLSALIMANFESSYGSAVSTHKMPTQNTFQEKNVKSLRKYDIPVMATMMARSPSYAIIGSHGYRKCPKVVVGASPTSDSSDALPGSETLTAGGGFQNGGLIAVVLIGFVAVCFIALVHAYSRVFHSPRQSVGDDKNKLRDELYDEDARVYPHCCGAVDKVVKNAARDGEDPVYSFHYSTTHNHTCMYYGDSEYSTPAVTPREYSKEFLASFDEAGADECIFLSMSIDTDTDDDDRKKKTPTPCDPSQPYNCATSSGEAAERCVSVDSYLSEEQQRVNYPYKVCSYKEYDSGASSESIINHALAAHEGVENRRVTPALSQQSVDVVTRHILHFQLHQQQQQLQPRGFIRPCSIIIPSANHPEVIVPHSPSYRASASAGPSSPRFLLSPPVHNLAS